MNSNKKNIRSVSYTLYTDKYSQIDTLYGPWNNFKEMVDTLTFSDNTEEDVNNFLLNLVSVGVTVGIYENDEIVEYWKPVEGEGFIRKSSMYVSKAEDNWKTSKIGGIRENMTKSDFEGKTVSEMLDDILYPTLYSSKTDPSISIVYSGSVSTLMKVGSNLPVRKDFSVTLNRGTLTYNNSDGNKFYGGTFGDATYTMNNAEIPSSDVKSSEGIYTFKVSVYCNPGATPLNNKGGSNIDPDALTNVTAYPGGTLTSTKKFSAVYSIYANTSSISTMTEQQLKDYNTSQVEYFLTIPAEEINGNKFMLELPDSLTLVSVKQKNMTNSKYDISVTMISNGTTTYSGKTYNKYIRTKTATDAIGKAEYDIIIKKK